MSADTPLPDRYLTLSHVEMRVARKKSWIYDQIRKGRFPTPDECRWFESEINAYLHARRTGRTSGRKPYCP